MEPKNKKKVYISAEYILPKCGLANYLELLVESFTKYCSEYELIVKTTNNFWEKQKGVCFEQCKVESRNNNLSPFSKKVRYVVRLFTPKPLTLILRKIWCKIKLFLKFIIKLISKKLFYYILYMLGEQKDIVAFWKRVDNSSVIILPHIPLSYSFIPYYKELTKKRLIWVIHDLHPFYFRDAWSREAIDICENFLPVMAKKASHIIVHNEFTKNSVIKYLKVDEKKITIVRLPFIIESHEADFTDDGRLNLVLKKYGIKKPYALWASSTTILHKNHERLIKAWEIINGKYGLSLQLVCTGSREPNWEKIKSLLELYNGKVEVVFTGTIDKDELIYILHNAELAVCPTLFEGGGCGPALEATIAGKPVACSNIPQILEQYDNRTDVCEFFDPNDENAIAKAVVKVYNNINYYKSKSVEARKIILKNRSWEGVVKLYSNVIQKFF